jgi:hypothetical protein
MVKKKLKLLKQNTIQKLYLFKSKCNCTLKKIFMCNSDCITEIDITPVQKERKHHKKEKN